MVKVLTKSHLLHEGQLIQPGEEIELNEKEVNIDRLVEVNAVELIEEEEKPKGKKQKENPGE
jgi:hypothetical protein